MGQILQMTAWPMTPPEPYSFFHILLSLAGAAFFLCLAWSLSRMCQKPVNILFHCGLLLAASELYKQLFLTVVVHSGTYDWWYFPFQLCSIPMYLCLILPFLKPSTRQLACTFIQDFGLLGGIMALVEPSGLMHSYITLTLHGFFWHFLLIFAGIFCFWTKQTDRTGKGFLRTLPLFLSCCLIAFCINWIAGPDTNIDMFYISPYYPCSQAVFHQIALKTGILLGNIIYLSAVIAGAFLVHTVLNLIFATGKASTIQTDNQK